MAPRKRKLEIAESEGTSEDKKQKTSCTENTVGPSDDAIESEVQMVRSAGLTILLSEFDLSYILLSFCLLCLTSVSAERSDTTAAANA